MTPVLLGRWQTRLFLLGTIGALVTAVFYFSVSPGGSVFWRVLFWVAAWGLLWDLVYIAIQQLKWDRDWPPYAQWMAGAWEGAFLYFFIKWVGLDIGIADLEIPKVALPTDRFIPHYACVWATTWFCSQTFMRAVFPLWRFHGGRIV